MTDDDFGFDPADTELARRLGSVGAARRRRRRGAGRAAAPSHPRPPPPAGRVRRHRHRRGGALRRRGVRGHRRRRTGSKVRVPPANRPTVTVDTVPVADGTDGATTAVGRRRARHARRTSPATASRRPAADHARQAHRRRPSTTTATTAAPARARTRARVRFSGPVRRARVDSRLGLERLRIGHGLTKPDAGSRRVRRTPSERSSHVRAGHARSRPRPIRTPPARRTSSACWRPWSARLPSPSAASRSPRPRPTPALDTPHDLAERGLDADEPAGRRRHAAGDRRGEPPRRSTRGRDDLRDRQSPRRLDADLRRRRGRNGDDRAHRRRRSPSWPSARTPAGSPTSSRRRDSRSRWCSATAPRASTSRPSSRTARCACGCASAPMPSTTMTTT